MFCVGIPPPNIERAIGSRRLVQKKKKNKKKIPPERALVDAIFTDRLPIYMTNKLSLFLIFGLMKDVFLISKFSGANPFKNHIQ